MHPAIRIIGLLFLCATFFIAGALTMGPLMGAAQDARKALPNLTVVAIVPTVCGTDMRSVEARNTVWRTLNGELLPDSPERHLALGLRGILRSRGGVEGLDAVERVVYRFAAYYDDVQRLQMFNDLTGTDVAAKIDVLQRIIQADRTGGDLLECVLKDEARMHAATLGEPVFLEALPTK